MELNNLTTNEKKRLESLVSKTRNKKETTNPKEVRLSVIPESKTKTESQLKNERRIKNLEESVTTLAEVMTDLVEREGLNTQEKTGQSTENDKQQAVRSLSLTDNAAKVYEELTDEYQSSQDIAEDVGLHPTTIRKTFPELKNKDLIDTKLGVGIKKNSGRETETKVEEEPEIICQICGQSFQTKGFSQHVKRVEDVDFKSYFETEDGTYKTEQYDIESDKWSLFKNTLNKTQGLPNLTEIVAENLLEIKKQQSKEEEETDGRTGNQEFQAILDELPESEVDRIDLLRQLSTNFYKTAPEVAEESGQPKASDSYYLKPFEEHGLIEMKRSSGSIIKQKGKDFLEWFDEDVSDNEEGDDVSPSEPSDLTKEDLLNEVNVSDKDFDVAALAFDKILNRKENDYVSYHLFEQHFEGDNIKPIRFYQKMFSNPAMVQHLLDAVGVENDWSWSKKQDFKDGMKNWVIELK